MGLVTGPTGLHRNSPQELNISHIRVFDQIRDPKIPITLRPPSKALNVLLHMLYFNIGEIGFFGSH